MLYIRVLQTTTISGDDLHFFFFFVAASPRGGTFELCAETDAAEQCRGCQNH